MATEHILFISYGKDSLACLGAIEQLGWPLDRIVHAEIWATDTIPADLPPMMEFKKKADRIIKERWGIEVEHVAAKRGGEHVVTYESIFYRPRNLKRGGNRIYGWPIPKGPWCNSDLKRASVSQTSRSLSGGATVQYVGIALDEPERLARLDGVTKISPLAAVGWTEADAKQWCIDNDLLSPIYESTDRGGCWFCHNQTIKQMRDLRHNYPDLWKLLLKWDADSPTTWHPDGRTVHDFDLRFKAEDLGLVPTDRKFRWKMLEADEVKASICCASMTDNEEQ